jgi:hypothetical protein
MLKQIGEGQPDQYRRPHAAASQPASGFIIPRRNLISRQSTLNCLEEALAPILTSLP